MEVCKIERRFHVVMRAVWTAILGSTIAVATARAGNPPVFDWSVNDGTGNPNYTPAPILTDGNVAAVQAILASRPAGSPLAVKIVTPISDSTAAAIFNNYKLNYVFADLEGPGALDQTKALLAQVRAGSSISNGAFVGEFNLYRLTPEFPSPIFQIPSNAGFGRDLGVNMTNEAAYPGSPLFPSAPTPQKPFPNLLSAFFVLPINRVTLATNQIAFASAFSFPRPGTYANIPWVARFNNYGNSFLNNDPNYMGYSYAFNTTGPNNPYANQLPSAGDFSAQMLHDRLRGASSYNLFNYSQPNASGSNTTFSSVIGYTVAQEQADAYNGFNGNTGPGNSQNTTLGAIFARNHYDFANLSNRVPTSPDHTSSSIATGMVLSGIYDDNGPNRQLALLLSNMNSQTQKVDFWQKYGGDSVDLDGATARLDQMYTIQPGTHELLQFNLIGDRWILFEDDQIFADSNRNGIGVPEPASLALLGVTAAALLLRRQRE